MLMSFVVSRLEESRDEDVEYAYTGSLSWPRQLHMPLTEPNSTSHKISSKLRPSLQLLQPSPSNPSGPDSSPDQPRRNLPLRGPQHVNSARPFCFDSSSVHTHTIVTMSSGDFVIPNGMENFVVGLIGMGDMGKMYAERLSAAGWR